MKNFDTMNEGERMDKATFLNQRLEGIVKFDVEVLDLVLENATEEELNDEINTAQKYQEKVAEVECRLRRTRRHRERSSSSSTDSWRSVRETESAGRGNAQGRARA